MAFPNGTPVAEESHEDTIMWREVFKRRLHAVEMAFETLTGRVDGLEAGLKENTKYTRDIVEILNSWKGTMTVVKWAAGILTPIAAVVIAASMLWNAFHGKLPNLSVFG